MRLLERLVKVRSLENRVHRWNGLWEAQLNSRHRHGNLLEAGKLLKLRQEESPRRKEVSGHLARRTLGHDGYHAGRNLKNRSFLRRLMQSGKAWGRQRQFYVLLVLVHENVVVAVESVGCLRMCKWLVLGICLSCAILSGRFALLDFRRLATAGCYRFPTVADFVDRLLLPLLLQFRAVRNEVAQLETPPATAIVRRGSVRQLGPVKEEVLRTATLGRVPDVVLGGERDHRALESLSDVGTHPVSEPGSEVVVQIEGVLDGYPRPVPVLFRLGESLPLADADDFVLVVEVARIKFYHLQPQLSWTLSVLALPVSTFVVEPNVPSLHHDAWLLAGGSCILIGQLKDKSHANLVNDFDWN